MDQSGISSEDEELDVTKPNFNPIKAIYSKRLFMKAENLPKFDNFSSFMSSLQRAGNKLDADLGRRSPSLSKKVDLSSDDKEKYHFSAGGRKFLREQGIV